MSKANSRMPDLNLLVVLDALLSKRSVTRAAAQLGVTQSAVSHRLKSLREQLGDPLFVSSRSGLLPTEAALEMAEPLRRALADIRSVVQVSAPFDAKNSTRHFVVASSDYGELMLLPNLLTSLEANATGITVSMVNRAHSYADELGAGTLDLAFVGPNLKGDALVQRRMLREPFVVLARKDHPLINKRLTMKTYLRCRHLLVSPSGRSGGIVDGLLAKQGTQRKVVARITNFIPAPFVVASSDLVVTLPASLALRTFGALPLRWFKAPLAIPPTDASMVWHERSQSDPAHRWLREQITSKLKVLQEEVDQWLAKGPG